MRKVYDAVSCAMGQQQEWDFEDIYEARESDFSSLFGANHGLLAVSGWWFVDCGDECDSGKAVVSGDKSVERLEPKGVTATPFE
jgi:hypothetical protein